MAENEQWAHKIDFVLACAGGAIGLGNVWRFPYVCFANGGGAFLIPYLIAAFVLGIPLFFLESCLGQLTGGDMVKVWKLIPSFKGVGYANIVMNFFMVSYFNVVLAWLARYLIASFSSVLPWNSCNNTWNTEDCITISLNESLNSSSEFINSSTKVSSVVEFWEKKVLTISNSINEVGSLNMELTLCLLVLWIVVYFCIWRGIKWSAKVIYFTVPLPFLLLFVVLIRGLTLEGASVGITFYLNPNISALIEPQVWVKAFEQVCFSYTIGWGVITTLASHNSFHHNFYRDAIAIVCLNIMTSCLSGFAVFSVLGYMANLQNVSITSVVESGPGLAFIAYPKALSLLPLPQLWSVLFFIMMLFLSIDSMFIAVETFTLATYNLLPKKIKARKWSYEIFSAFYMGTLCLTSLVMVTEGGYYIFRVYEFGSSGWCILFTVLCETIGVAWVLGADKFLNYAKIMLKREPILQIYLKICWKYILPILIPVLFASSLANNYSISYPDHTPYPGWAIALGWMIALAAILWIPFCAIMLFVKSDGTLYQKLSRLLEVNEHACLRESTYVGPEEEKCIKLDEINV